MIEGNTFVGGDNGVWIASRMAENTFPMNCTDPEYVTGIYRLDYAQDNTVRGNVFQDVTYGVRVEDDRNTVADNTFVSSDPAHLAVLIGTPLRTSKLGLPVDGTASPATAPHRRQREPVSLGPRPREHDLRRQPQLRPTGGLLRGRGAGARNLVIAIAVVLLDPNNPPTGDPPVFPAPAPLPPCPASCATGPAIAQPRIVVRRLGTPPGDDTLLFSGEMQLDEPFVPALDPLATGVQIVLADASGRARSTCWSPVGPGIRSRAPAGRPRPTA